MNKEDEDEFLNFLRTTGEVSVFPYTSKSREFVPVNSLPDRFSGNFSGTFWLFNRNISSNLKVEFIPNQGYFTIDESKSSVIQFARSGIKEKTLLSGRIWAEFTYLDKEKMILLPKEPEFKTWFDSIAKWIRKKYKHMDSLYYAGPGAEKLFEEGFTRK